MSELLGVAMLQAWAAVLQAYTNSVRSMNVKSFTNRVMILAGVQAFLHYFVGGMNDPMKFVIVTGYEINQTISHRIVWLRIEFICGELLLLFLRKVGYL